MSPSRGLPGGSHVDEAVPGGVMAILRGQQSTFVDPSIETLIDTGFRCLEVTLTTPDALQLISRWAVAAPSGVQIGCGTVMRASEARAAIDAGARFIVAPNFSEDVVAACHDRSVPVYPAGWTPTEIAKAWDAGAAAVKLFPASVGGPDYVRQLRGPMPAVRLIPTGGIDVSQAAEYLAAGADGVGLGSPLLGDALNGGDQSALRDRAANVLDAVRACTRERV